MPHHIDNFRMMFDCIVELPDEFPNDDPCHILYDFEERRLFRSTDCIRFHNMKYIVTVRVPGPMFNLKGLS